MNTNTYSVYARILGTLFGGVVCALLLIPLAQAQTDAAGTRSDRVNAVDVRPDARNTPSATQLRNTRDAAGERRDQLQDTLQNRRDAAVDAVQERRANITDRKSDIQENREDRASQLEERKKALTDRAEERRAQLTDKAKDRIRAYLERVFKRFAAAINRLESIASRVESRIEKLENRGLDMTEAKRLLGVYESALDTAKEDLRAAQAAVEEVVASDSPRDSFAKVRELIQGAKDSLKEARRALVEVIKVLKASVGNVDSSDNEDDGTTDTE